MPVNPETNVRKIVTLPRPLLARVKRYRFRREMATEAEAIRRLLSEALDAAGIERDEPAEPKRPRRRPSSGSTGSPPST